jgi:hypothetical protein
MVDEGKGHPCGLVGIDRHNASAQVGMDLTGSLLDYLQRWLDSSL